MSNKVVLLGSGVGVKFIIESLIQNKELGYHVAAIVTHPFKDHAEDIDILEKRADYYGEYAYNVFDAPKDYGIELLESDDVNNENTRDWISQFNPAYLISVGCRNIIRKQFLAQFPNRVLNIHTTPLPKYRGAANDSWMILNGLWGTKQYGCAHFIDEGIDTGNIVAKSYYTVPDRSYPVDVFKMRMNAFKHLLVEALQNLKDPSFKGEKQLVDEAIYFPRLYTPVDGKISFEKYSGEELERFVFAFGYPFDGAHCFFEEEKINVLDVEFKNDLKFHSFASGIIFGKNENNEYKVAVKGGYLLLKKIEVKGEVIAQNKLFKLGKKLS